MWDAGITAEEVDDVPQDRGNCGEGLRPVGFGFELVGKVRSEYVSATEGEYAAEDETVVEASEPHLSWYPTEGMQIQRLVAGDT